MTLDQVGYFTPRAAHQAFVELLVPSLRKSHVMDVDILIVRVHKNVK